MISILRLITLVLVAETKSLHTHIHLKKHTIIHDIMNTYFNLFNIHTYTSARLALALVLVILDCGASRRIKE